MKKSFLFGQNATFSNTTNLQSHMVNNLNSEIFTRNELSEDAYYVYSGYGQSAVNQINFDIKQRFPLRTLPDLNYTINDQDFISFAYLFKNFRFKAPFQAIDFFRFKNVTVPAFQTSNAKQRSQLHYKYYNSSNDFMIGIKT